MDDYVVSGDEGVTIYGGVGGFLRERADGAQRCTEKQDG
jgi:hypothetical protein